MKKKLFLGIVAATAILGHINYAEAQTRNLIVRARASLAAGYGPVMEVRVDGQVVGSTEVRNTNFIDYVYSVPNLAPGSSVDVVFTNDYAANGEDRNLFIAYLREGDTTVLPNISGAVFDRGERTRAFDGLDVIPGQGDLFWSGALRLKWPAGVTKTATSLKAYDAARFLNQATFGATTADTQALLTSTYEKWIDSQIAKPARPNYVDYVQSKFNAGPEYRPNGTKYNYAWVNQQFWKNAALADDQLRQRVAFALHNLFMISFVDSSQWLHSRAFANYLDKLNSGAFGNFRAVLEDVALSPAMGLYLSHLRNRKEDPTSGRLPDENFAREVMQLFTIGLYELNQDGSIKRDASGAPIETYTNDDVMAMARVFTGWGWGFPADQRTSFNFLYGAPDYAANRDTGVDLARMAPYPAYASTAEKKIFSGKAYEIYIPAGVGPEESVKVALDGLFRHPNVPPFISRQLIQRLVTSNPSPGYVARVANVFVNNGRGVRGDLGAVVKAILLDSEARTAGSGTYGKLKEPVLALSQWMRAFKVKSVSGEYMMSDELKQQMQRPSFAPSVFGYFRPGYIPPNTQLAAQGMTSPEFQIVSEQTTASWVNMAESLASLGIGYNAQGARDIVADYSYEASLVADGDVDRLVEHLNSQLFAGTMSTELKNTITDAVIKVSAAAPNRALQRAQLAVFLALASSEFRIQR